MAQGSRRRNYLIPLHEGAETMNAEQVEAVLNACRKVFSRELTMAELAEFLRGIKTDANPEPKKKSHVQKHGTG